MEDTMTVDDAGLLCVLEPLHQLREASDDARKKSERDRDYVDGKQLTDEELSLIHI